VTRIILAVFRIMPYLPGPSSTVSASTLRRFRQDVSAARPGDLSAGDRPPSPCCTWLVHGVRGTEDNERRCRRLNGHPQTSGWPSGKTRSKKNERHGMSTSQGSVSVRGARIMSARVVQSTHEAAPRAVSRACRAVRHFRRAWGRCWAGAACVRCAPGWAPVAGGPRLGAGAEARSAAVRATYGLPCVHDQLSRGVGVRAWPMALFREIDCGVAVRPIGGGMYLF
jgi:hypothetical protein